MSSTSHAVIAEIPKIKTPKPAWATAFPSWAPGADTSRPIFKPRLHTPVLAAKSAIAPAIIHTPSVIPIGARILEPVCSDHASAPSAKARTSAPHIRLKDCSIDPRFQGSSAPIGSRAARRTTNGVKAKSKNGGPTETTFPKTISAARGQNVPTKTTNTDTTSNALFMIRADSRLTKPKAPFGTSNAERYAKSANPPPENAKRIASMNTPRAGSLANA